MSVAGGREVRRHLIALLIVCGLSVAPDLADAQSSRPGFTPRDENPEEYPAGPGREETFYACTPCHNFKLVAAQGMTRERWDETLTFMTQRHNMPSIEGTERERVLDYLAGTYPPRAPARAGGWQNPFTKQ
jgi:hypothetical protein